MDTTYPSVRLAGHTLKNPDMLTPFILLDLPLSAALDTVKLPSDAVNGRRPSRRLKLGQSALAAPLTKEESEKLIEAAIRKAAEKPTGELTKADLEKVTSLVFYKKQLTNVKGLENLTRLTHLNLKDNPDFTEAWIVWLQKALPKCYIDSDFD